MCVFILSLCQFFYIYIYIHTLKGYRLREKQIEYLKKKKKKKYPVCRQKLQVCVFKLSYKWLANLTTYQSAGPNLIPDEDSQRTPHPAR